MDEYLFSFSGKGKAAHPNVCYWSCNTGVDFDGPDFDGLGFDREPSSVWAELAFEAF